MLYDLSSGKWYSYIGKEYWECPKPEAGTEINGYCYFDGERLIGYFNAIGALIIFDGVKKTLALPSHTRCIHTKEDGQNELLIYNRDPKNPILVIRYYFDETCDFTDPYEQRINIGDRISGHLESEITIRNFINAKPQKVWPDPGEQLDEWW